MNTMNSCKYSVLAFIGAYLANLTYLPATQGIDVNIKILYEDPLATFNRVRKNLFSKEYSIKALTSNDTARDMLMEKAKMRSAQLEIRLFLLTDYMRALALIEDQYREYVDTYESLEPGTLVNYAAWCMSVDSGTPTALLEKIYNLLNPPSKNQGLWNMLASFLGKMNLKPHPSGSGDKTLKVLYNIDIKRATNRSEQCCTTQ